MHVQSNKQDHISVTSTASSTQSLLHIRLPSCMPNNLVEMEMDSCDVPLIELDSSTVPSLTSIVTQSHYDLTEEAAETSESIDSVEVLESMET